MFPPVLALAAVAVGTVPGAAALLSARWPYRSPAAAILLWQALGLSWGLAAVGALAGLGARPAGWGVAGGALTGAADAARAALGSGPAMLAAIARLVFLTASATLLALLCWVLLAASATVVLARRRHLALLRLLAHGDPKVPGALVVDSPAAAAYCVPGLRSQIVVSAGTLDLLDAAELAAVLAHERAHLRARHDLVLLPFSALGRAFPRCRLVRQAQGSVGLLVEMLADDRALRHRPARELATALIRVGASGAGLAPSGALAAVQAPDGETAARVARLLVPAPPLPAPALALILSAAAALVAVPVGLLLLPW
ncbi:MAG TPA: M56 family metallopeptidase [Streptosporangiaceae bacterium]|nr:M56 family metallopeptidase [Streptosporangiaceae bacterium]